MARIAGDLAGLAKVIETTLARVNSSRSATSLIASVSPCLLICAESSLVLDPNARIGPGYLRGACSVVSGGCATLCKFDTRFRASPGCALVRCYLPRAPVRVRGNEETGSSRVS